MNPMFWKSIQIKIVLVYSSDTALLISQDKITMRRNGWICFTEIAPFMLALLHYLAMQVTAALLKSKAIVSHSQTISQANAHKGKRQGT